ncbi:MAG: ABC transporter substrate-binding protein [Dehalococcoidia bacterium]|nr:ABC transporter substrate-binding protein [Dehalococcoidia bacterium]MDP7511891.1 ABC transporter substrate-binding protein [Dehalococcoidia bacterium]
MYDVDGELAPMLATSWSVSEDFITWTFKLRQGVQFQKGYGEMTAEDVAWSHEMIATSERHPSASDAWNIWLNENGSVTTPDDYTVALNTGEPFSDIGIKELMATPRSSVAYIVSKKQNDEIGEDETNRNTAATGPWEIEESRSAELWRLIRRGPLAQDARLCRAGPLGGPRGVRPGGRLPDRKPGHLGHSP